MPFAEDLFRMRRRLIRFILLGSQFSHFFLQFIQITLSRLCACQLVASRDNPRVTLPLFLGWPMPPHPIIISLRLLDFILSFFERSSLVS